ncbi:MAG TPA: peptidyl-alpha-hydroxyglycine alpha-amidating lyase family protein [Candidatus Binataceae bacterium]|nr:peptidyl-alpha-hydroxyglycine alpha-amidating lyase family protein [Candidatus Binataceae bacterium]
MGDAMAKQTGSGEYIYEIVENWAHIPGRNDWNFDVAGIGVDARDRVYLFNRGPTPVIVVDRDGNYLHHWGDKQTFPNAHAVTMGPDDTIWLTDTFDHTVRKCRLDGEILMTLGVPGKPARAMSGEPFNQCTHVAIHPGTGEFFVSDGYGNAKVHKYAPDGRRLFSWGEPGNAPGQFNLPHNICCDRDGYVYVADRHNHRVQVFTPNGRLEAVWYGMALPCGMCIDTTGTEQLCYIGELSSALWIGLGPSPLYDIWNSAKTMGPRVSVWTLDGQPLARLCDNGMGEEPDQLFAPHGMAVDRDGNIYVAEVSWILSRAFNKGEQANRPMRNAVKLKRVRHPDRGHH